MPPQKKKNEEEKRTLEDNRQKQALEDRQKRGQVFAGDPGFNKPGSSQPLAKKEVSETRAGVEITPEIRAAIDPGAKGSGRPLTAEEQAQVQRIKELQTPEGRNLAAARQAIAENPEAFGFNLENEFLQNQSIPPQQQPLNPLLTGLTSPTPPGLQGIIPPPEQRIGQLGALAVTGGGVAGYRIAKTGKIFFNAKKAAQAGTAERNAKLASAPLKTIGAFSTFLLSAGAGFGIGNFFNRRADDQQQALNTLGQVTSTIVGSSTSSAGDWREGLRELDNLESEILKLERAVKNGQIKEQTLAFNGKVIDLNADIYDQLTTIQEGRTDIQSFVLSDSFPELSDLEIQQILEELRADGIIETVDFSEFRRETDL